MNKKLLYFYLIMFAVFMVYIIKKEYEPKLDPVYVCIGRSSRVYHKSNACEGLDKCSKLIHIEKSSALSTYDRRSCNYCYPVGDQIQKNFNKAEIIPSSMNDINGYDKMPPNIDEIPFYGTDN